MLTPTTELNVGWRINARTDIPSHSSQNPWSRAQVPVLSQLRVRSIPQYVTKRRGWERHYDDWVSHGMPWRYALHGPHGWYAAENDVHPLLLADGWFIDLPGLRENFGYEPPSTPGDETFFDYLCGDLANELKAMISDFRGF